jgi:DNA primase
MTTLKPLLQRLPDGHYRDLVIGQLAETSALAREQIEQRLAGDRPAREPDPPRRPQHAGRSRMRAVMTFILHHPGAVRAAGPVPGLEEFDAPGADLLRRLLEIAGQEPQLRTGQFIEQFRLDTERNWVRQLASAEPEPLESDDEAPKFLRDSLELMLADHRKLAKVQAIRQHGQTRDGAS